MPPPNVGRGTDIPNGRSGTTLVQSQPNEYQYSVANDTSLR